MKNVLLLGGNGFLGKNLAKRLACDASNFTVSVFDIAAPKETVEGVSYYVGSINDSEKIFSIMKEQHIEVLVHMVSTIIPGSSLQQYVENCRLVQLSTIPLMDYCAKNNVELVYLSSGGTVYGVKGGVISENEPTAPISYYGLSKVQIEDLINFYHRRFGLNYLILRPSNPYGHGQNLYGKQGLIAVVLGKILKNEPVIVFGDGNTIRDYIYIDDFVFYVKELIRKGILNETINIGSGEGYSVNQIIDIVNVLVGHKIDVEYTAARGDDVPKMILDTTRLHNFIHHENISLEMGISTFYKSIIK
jgi:UDP-glucose 4-epimerase